MKETKRCEACGAKIVEYRHAISVPLVTGLRRLYQAGGGPLNLKRLSLTRNQWDNFQKLRYWHLVFQVEIDGRRKKGVWAITPQGKEFLFNERKIPEHVWTYRGNTVRFSDRLIQIVNVVDWYEQRPDYGSNAEPHDDDDGQPTLF